MPRITQLPVLEAVSAGDLLPIFDQSNGDARKMSLSELSDYILSLLTGATDKFKQQAAPLSTGFVVAIAENYSEVWLQLLPVASFASGTITLPSANTALDNQEILVTSSKQINSIAFNLNGAAAFNGAPTVLAADDYFKARFDSSTVSWYRVG